jgi:hypothetical protein
MSPIFTFQLSPLNHKWTICSSMVMTGVMVWWEDWHHSVCIGKQLSENPAFILAPPSKCKHYSNIYSLMLMISRRMLDVPTPLYNHLLLIVTFQSSPSNCKWTICGMTATTVAGWTCGAGNNQQFDMYKKNREETKYTSEEMKKRIWSLLEQEFWNDLKNNHVLLPWCVFPPFYQSYGLWIVAAVTSSALLEFLLGKIMLLRLYLDSSIHWMTFSSRQLCWTCYGLL